VKGVNIMIVKDVLEVVSVLTTSESLVTLIKYPITLPLVTAGICHDRTTLSALAVAIRFSGTPGTARE
jgi:hypothetical protein